MRRLLALAALARVVSKETPPNGAPWRHSEVNGQRTLEVYQDGWGVAHYAAWDNDVATLEAVDGATLAARDAHGQAAVHVAAMAGHVAALEMLAARGAAGELNGRGETAVAVAAQLGRATWLKRAGELGGTELLDGVPLGAGGEVDERGLRFGLGVEDLRQRPQERRTGHVHQAEQVREQLPDRIGRLEKDVVGRG